MIRKNPSGDLPSIYESACVDTILCGENEQVSPQVSDFSEPVLKANHELARGYKNLQNEFSFQQSGSRQI